MDKWMLPDSITWIMDAFGTSSKLLGPVVLAGGAPRDLLLGAVISDYDFFTPMRYRTAVAISTIGAIMGLRGYAPTTNPRHDDIVYDSTLFVTYTFTHPYEVPVQFMFYDREGVDFLDSFDLSTSQIMIDMDGSLTTSLAFDDSVIERKHRMYMKNLKTRYQFEKAFLNHLPRVLTKYPWPAIVDYSGCDLPSMINKTHHLEALSSIVEF